MGVRPFRGSPAVFNFFGPAMFGDLAPEYDSYLDNFIFTSPAPAPGCLGLGFVAIVLTARRRCT